MKKQIETDLACESYEADLEKDTKNGIISSLYEINEYSIIETKITNQVGEELTGKKMGKYLTLYAKNVWKYTEIEQKKVSDALSFCIKDLVSTFNLKSPSYLVAGLGNRQISADALGPLSVDKLIPTHHLKNNKKLYSGFGYDLSLLAPLVLGQGGIDSEELVKNAIKSTNATCLILIDSLSTSSIDRLCTTFQVANTGLTPASATTNSRREISKETVGIPVISIGVPCAISIYALTQKQNSIKYNNFQSNLLLCPKDIDIIAKELSKIIADAITKAIKDE